MPKVSVIVPVYNVETYLKKSMDCLLNQTLYDLEFICIDDCSCDNSLDILREYETKDSRFKIISCSENQGAAVARNKGLEIAQGEYLSFIDPDDSIDLNYYEELYKKAKENDYDIVKCKREIIRKDKIVSSNELNNDIKKSRFNFAFEWTTAIYKKEIIDRNNIKFHDIVVGEDILFLNEFLLASKTLAVIDSVCYYYHKRNESLLDYSICFADKISSFVYSIKTQIKNINNYFIFEQDISLYNKLILRKIKNLIDKYYFSKDKNLRLILAENIIDVFYMHKDTEYFKIHFSLKRILKHIVNKDIKNLYKTLNRYKSYSDLVLGNTFLQNIFSVKNIKKGKRKRKVITILGIKIKIKKQGNIKIELEKTFLQNIFSVKNIKKGKRKTKVITILGIKIKIKKQKNINMETRKLYYYRYNNNFGDILNIDLLKFFNQNIKWTNKYKCDVIAIGSLLGSLITDNLTFKDKKNLFFSKPLIIYGSGFVREETEKEYLLRKVEVKAVRGFLSLERLKKMKYAQIDKNVAIGDPGLLVSKIFDVTNMEKKYDLGIIPHYIDKNSPFLKNITVKNSIILNINQEPIELLTQIAQCKNIISSAMHGLIAADSLGIPNVRMILSDKIIGGDYKFNDYYSAFGLKNHEKINLMENKFTDEDLVKIKENYKIKKETVEEIQQKLINVFPYKQKEKTYKIQKLEEIPQTDRKTKGNMKIIAVDGFCWSGSGALVDLLSEFENVKLYSNQNIFSGNYTDVSKTKGNEFKFFINKHSIFNLRDVFDKTNMEKDIAIKQFISYFYEKALSGESIDAFGGNFIKINIDFLENILDLDEYTKNYMKNKEYPYTLFGKSVEEYKNCSFLYDKCKAPYIFYKFKDISINEFDFYISNYIYDFFNNIQSSNILVFDQMFSYSLKLDKMNYYIHKNPIKEICVYRDPRDQYVAWYKESPNADILKSPQSFINFYKKFVIPKIKLSSENRLCIKFEDLIFNYDKTVKKICDFINIETIEHIDKKQIFIPEISEKNIGIHEDFHDQTIIEEIKRKLYDYCYDVSFK